MKQMRLSGTPQSGSLPSEDYESKETLKAIDQLVESMERDEKHISQLDTNRRVQSCSSPDTFVFVQFQMFFFNQTRLSVLDLLDTYVVSVSVINFLYKLASLLHLNIFLVP